MDTIMDLLPLPYNIIIIIGEYAAYRLNKDDLIEIKHKYADITLKRFNKNIINNWLDYNYEMRKANNYDNTINFGEYLYNFTTKTQLEYILDGFISCECCQRHSYNGNIRKITKKESNNIINSYTNKSCSCPCRHNGRFILRILENYY